MKYETPELTALLPATNVIQGLGSKPRTTSASEGHTPTAPVHYNEHVSAYIDWE